MNYTIVTEPSSNLRALARAAMRGKWKTAILATTVYMVAILVPTLILDAVFGGEDGVSVLSGIYTILVTPAFTIGFSMFCMDLFRGKPCEPAQVFYGFERFWKAICLYVVMVVFVLLWTLLFVIPGIIAAYRYSMCFFVMIDHPEYGAVQCLNESKRIMMGNKMKLFCLEFSFIGWTLLASIISGAIMMLFAFGGTIIMSIGTVVGCIPYLWITPYISVAMVALYELATGNLRQGVIDVQPIQQEPVSLHKSSEPENRQNGDNQ